MDHYYIATLHIFEMYVNLKVALIMTLSWIETLRGSCFKVLTVTQSKRCILFWVNAVCFRQFQERALLDVLLLNQFPK